MQARELPFVNARSEKLKLASLHFAEQAVAKWLKAQTRLANGHRGDFVLNCHPRWSAPIEVVLN
jgi:hypothetical protein